MGSKNNYRILSFVGLLFFVIGFALGINGLLVPYLQKAFSLSSAESYLVVTATFGAFVVFGYPSGLIIKKIGYRKSMSLSFLFFAIGLFLFIPSAKYESFAFFLVASFISGMGNTMLQASVNPYVTICGPISSAAQRICIMGILNKSGWAIAPIFLSLFLDLSKAKINLSSMYFPFLIIVALFIVLGLITMMVKLPEIKAEGEDEESVEGGNSETIVKFVSQKKNIFQFPHLLLGAFALFYYVGVETIALATPVDFANTIGLSNPQIYTTYTVLSMVVGYIIGAACIPKLISQHGALKICSLTGIVFSLLAVFVRAKYAIFFVALMGLSNSLMWGAIWPLAISYLGKYTKTGSSLLVMAIVGGAIFPFLFGVIKDISGIQHAYWLCLPFYIYALYYSISGYKAGLREILDSGK